jgi:hypothetical protein
VRIDVPDIEGDVRLVGGDVRIDSVVNGNLAVQAENIVLGPNAHINGTFTYKSPKQAVLESGAVVVGETAYTKSPDVREAAKLGLVAFFSIWFVAKMFMVFSGALVIAYVFQRFADELVLRAVSRPLAEFGRGVIFVIVTPIVSVLKLFINLEPTEKFHLIQIFVDQRIHYRNILFDDLSFDAAIFEHHQRYIVNFPFFQERGLSLILMLNIPENP